jgi:hypothetical protein
MKRPCQITESRLAEGFSLVSVKRRKIDIPATRAFSWPQDVRLLRSSTNFEILPKRGATEAFRAEITDKTIGNAPSCRYLALKHTGKTVGNAPSCRYLAPKHTDKTVGNAPSCRYLAPKHTDKTVGNAPSCRYFALKHGATETSRAEKYRQNHPNCTVLNVLECVANANQATTRSAMYSASRTTPEPLKDSEY